MPGAGDALMTHSPHAPDRTSRAREQRATRAAFFIAGFGTSAWAPLVPYAKMRLAVDDGTLGLLLLCLGAGSIAAMPLSGALAMRFGCRRVISAAGLLVCAALPVLATAGSIQMLAAGLLLFGGGVGTVDVVVNIQAVLVERQAKRPLMSGFHGFYSVGGIAGAAGVSAVLASGGSPLAATSGVAAAIVATLLLFGHGLLRHGGDRQGPIFVPPRGVVLLIGSLCFICFLAEGSMLDWGALILTTVHGVNPAWSGLGYAVFSAMMTVGRLSGDRITRLLGGQRMLLAGGLVAASGMVLAVLAPSWPGVLAGFALVGLGAANIVPVLYSAVGRQQVMPMGAAVSAVTTIGYLGILAGPAGIGLIANVAGLSTAFLGVATLLLVIAACSDFALLKSKDGALPQTPPG